MCCITYYIICLYSDSLLCKIIYITFNLSLLKNEINNFFNGSGNAVLLYGFSRSTNIDNMKKKIFYAIITAVIGTATASAYDVKVDNIYYNIVDDAYLEVTAIEDYLEYYKNYLDAPAKKAFGTPSVPNDYAGEIVIPDSVKIDGYDSVLPVKTIRHSAFWAAQKLVSVTLSATIEDIGNAAFAGSSIKLLDMEAATIEAIPDFMCDLCANCQRL